jgi:hypothetical protein
MYGTTGAEFLTFSSLMSQISDTNNPLAEKSHFGGFFLYVASSPAAVYLSFCFYFL